VTEWLEGTTLERYLHRQGTLSLSHMLEWLLPCIDVLAAAHEAGLAHGDLRPANIFLCRASGDDAPSSARARVLNFELGSCLPAANAVRAIGDRWERRDSRQYVPPELLLGGPLDARSDVYTFGVLLYRSLAGVLPFAASDSDDLAKEIVAGAHVPFRQRGTHLAPHVLDVIDRAMSTQPADRYANMRELGVALLRAVSRPLPLHFDRPAGSASGLQPSAAPKPRRFSDWSWLGLVAILVAVGAALGYGLRDSNLEHDVHALTQLPASGAQPHVVEPLPLPPRLPVVIDVDISQAVDAADASKKASTARSKRAKPATRHRGRADLGAPPEDRAALSLK
jgi:serine/threonine protein kinase